MPIGPYSPCPGGNPKKVKFCCGDLLGDLQKIEQMLEAEQHVACLKLVQQLREDRPDRACLLAIETQLLRVLGRDEDAAASAARFLQEHPNNPIALAEAARAAASTQGGREGMELLSRAIMAGGDEIAAQVYEAMSVTSYRLAVDGQFLAASALAALQTDIHRNDPRPRELLVQLQSAPSIPLAAKGIRALESCPDDVPWKPAFDEALALARRVHWAAAAERFEALAQQVGDQPAIWQNLALLRGWLADTPGCRDALEKFASLDVPLEDAVEAETLRLYLCEDPLGDQLEVFTLRHEVDDPDALEAALLAAPHTEHVPTDRAAPADDEEPPPKAVFILFDQPIPESGELASIESLPRVISELLLFGRQTDRPARLEATGVTAGDLKQVETFLSESADGQLGSKCDQEVTDHVSATQEFLGHNWWLPKGTSPEAFRELVRQYVEDSLLNVWPRSPLGLLDGTSPQDVADQPAWRVKLLAAVMLVDFWLARAGVRFDCNQLRSRLGLPTLGPIDPHETPLENVPLARLSRVMVEKLSDDALTAGYQRAMTFGAAEAAEKFARQIVDRPGLAGRQDQLRAFAMLARTSEDREESLSYVERGRQAALAAGQSSASWDLLELSFRFQGREVAEISRLMEHIQREHFEEPGVAEALGDLLVRVGILRPDGTPAVPEGPPADEQAAVVVPGDPVAEPGELWTPDSQKPPGEKPKIWTPGID